MKKIRRNFKTKKEFYDYYDRTAKSYDRDRSGDFEGALVDRLQRDFVYKNLGLNKGKVIECGCGTGRILLHLAKKGLDCTGVDVAKGMLNILKNNAKSNNLNVELKEGAIENVPFKDDSFDGVFSIHVLMHLPDSINSAVKEMYRLAKPGSKIIFDLPNADSPWTKLAVRLKPRMKRTQLFTLKRIRKEFQGYDYQVNGLFSYARTLFKIPLIKYFFAFLNSYWPMPLKFRTQYMVIITKR
jgi:ubiquinone/menaquinone biosynthesis C-methylase UbiE